MIHLREIASEDFVLFHADRAVVQASDLVRQQKPTRVIVRRWDEGTVSHYLYLPEAFLDSLAGLEQQPLEEALQLSEKTPTPAVDLYADAFEAPFFCVVTDGERVAGFYDVSLPPAKGIRGGGGEPPLTPVSRSLLAEFPEEIALGQSASLLVSLVRDAVKQALPIAVSIGTQIDIVIQIRHGFALESSGEESLIVTDEEETLPIRFKLRATEIGPSRIRVLSYHGGQPLGALTLTPLVVAADQRVDEERSSQEQPLAPLATTSPDLTLLIFENTIQGERQITLRLSALNPKLGLNLKPFGPIKLHMDPQQYFQDFFKNIEKMDVHTPKKQDIAARKLALRGASLFQKLVPEELRVLLWDLRKQIRTVQVQSDEPWIPWELLKLQGREKGRVVEGPFLCEAFAMTRWFPGIGRQPKLRLRRIATVMPTDSGLKHKNQERDYLRSLANSERYVSEIPATYLDVVEALSKGEHDGWHFTGHGRFKGYQQANISTIRLEEEEELSADEISGQVSNCGLAQPLVFLNACQTGRQTFSLTGMGGWAKQFIEVGAAAFIGSLWEVHDETAYQFAKAFYGHLLAGETIGEAAFLARKAIQPRHDLTWLAYTVFADPLAKVQP